MKTNWLWTAWAHLMLALVIALQVGWIVFAAIFLIPKFQKLVNDGVIDLAYFAADESWMSSFLDWVYDIYRQYAMWLGLGAAVLAGLFEWRVKSENKTFMRLSAWSTVAVGLTVVSALVGASLALPHLVSGPVTNRMAVTYALVQIDRIDTSIKTLEQALVNKDWDAMKEPAAQASQALYILAQVRPAVPGLWSRNGPTVEELRTLVKDANNSITEVRQAISSNDAEQIAAGLRQLRRSYAPVREAAKSAR